MDKKTHQHDTFSLPHAVPRVNTFSTIFLPSPSRFVLFHLGRINKRITETTNSARIEIIRWTVAMAIAITSGSTPSTGWVMKNSVSMYINANSRDPKPPGNIDAKPITIEPEIANVQNDNSVTLEEVGVQKAIEQVFSKLKTLVRKAKVRKVDELWRKLGEFCDHFPPQECQNYFRHTGYRKMTNANFSTI